MLSKCVAGREKGRAFARGALAAGLVRREELASRVGDLPVDDERRTAVRRWLAAR